MASYRDQVIADGATLYLRLDETSGTTASSQVGGYTGTISGGVQLKQAGALADGNSAMDFDATGDYVSIPNGAYQAIGTGPVTVELWVNPVIANPATPPFIFDNNGGANGKGFSILRSAVNAFNWKIANGTTNQNATVIVTITGAWIHLVGVLLRGTPDKLQLFVNGVLGGEVTLSSSGWDITPSLPLFLGVYSGGSASPDFRYFGLIDEVAIYPVALTATQIAAHYKARTLLAIPWHDLRYRWCRYVPARRRRRVA
jgi:hypothetical protein